MLALEKTKAGIMTIPALQDVMRRAVNLRSDLLDKLDQQMESVARRLNLATRREMKTLRRQIRELENQVQGLEGQLTSERQRAERAEGSLGEALKATREADAKGRKALEAASAKPEPKAEAKPEPKPEATPELPGIAASDASLAAPEAPEDEGDRPATKRAARAKKKAEPEEGG